MCGIAGAISLSRRPVTELEQALTAMSHIAVQEKLNGSPVEWMEQVTDEQYGG